MKHFEIFNCESRINEYQNIFECKIDDDLYLISITSGGANTEIDIHIWQLDYWKPLDPKPYELKSLARKLDFLYGKKHRRVVRQRKYSDKQRKNHYKHIMQYSTFKTKNNESN
jgi:hypothetical protein